MGVLCLTGREIVTLFLLLASLRLLLRGLKREKTTTFQLTATLLSLVRSTTNNSTSGPLKHFSA